MIISECRFFCFSVYELPNYLRRGQSTWRLPESWKRGPGSWSYRQDWEGSDGRLGGPSQAGRKARAPQLRAEAVTRSESTSFKGLTVDRRLTVTEKKGGTRHSVKWFVMENVGSRSHRRKSWVLG